MFDLPLAAFVEAASNRTGSGDSLGWRLAVSSCRDFQQCEFIRDFSATLFYKDYGERYPISTPLRNGDNIIRLRTIAEAEISEQKKIA